MMRSKYVFRLLYALLILFVCGFVYFGRTYYFSPNAERLRHSLHPLLRQSGLWGHGLGVVGTAFMILLLVYSLRKRLRLMKSWGDLNIWLEVHIFMGFTGPLFVLLHTDFRFSGIVALSFWAMVLVVLSGIFGRYIYNLIPRSLSGMEYNRIELEAEEIGLTFEIRKMLPRDHSLWSMLADLEHAAVQSSRAKAFVPFLSSWPVRRRLKKAVSTAGVLDPKVRGSLFKLVMKRQLLYRKLDLLDSTHKIMHYWHLLHRPFVILMFLILIVHVYVSFQMGYRWIF